jgi:hypothetical protein
MVSQYFRQSNILKNKISVLLVNDRGMFSLIPYVLCANSTVTEANYRASTIRQIKCEGNNTEM